MLSNTASEVPGMLACLYWERERDHTLLCSGRCQWFSCFEYYNNFCVLVWWGEELKEAKVWGNLYNPANELWHHESNSGSAQVTWEFCH